MENEGIMGLPAGQDMQNPAPPQQPAYVSSAESYDAALQGLGIARNDPSQAEAVKQAVRESIDELALSPTEIAAVLDVLEYMSQNPDQYPELRQRLIDSGMMDPDDLPETYDAAYLGMAIMVLNEYQASGVEGAQAPMQMAPEVADLGPMPMAEGGLADIAQYLASRGRNGDSMLAHITPAEARLLKQAGGAGTVNPDTGIREFFLKKLFKGVKKAVKKLLKNPIVRVVATVALAAVIGPAAIGLGMSTAAATATASVLSSAAVSAAAGEKINAKSLLINAATSYFGAGGTIGSVNPVSSIAKFASKIPGVTEGGKLAQGIGAGVTSAAIGKAAGLSTEEALGMGLQQGVMTGVTYKPQAPATADTTPPDVASGMGGDMSGARAPEASTAPAAQQVGAAPTGAIGTAAELPNAPAMRYSPTTGQYTPSATAQAATGTMADIAAMPTGGAQPSTVLGRMGQFVQDLMPGGAKPTLANFKDAFLVNPYAKTELGKFVPAGLTLAGIGAATGGFETEPVNESPLFDRRYGGAEFIRDNPQMFSGNLGRIEGMPPSYNPVVPTPSYTGRTTPIPFTPVPMPRGATVPAPAMVAPPQGIEAIYGYGLPELNPPVSPPVYMAKGGAVNEARQVPVDYEGFSRSMFTPAQIAQLEEESRARNAALAAIDARPAPRDAAPVSSTIGGPYGDRVMVSYGNTDAAGNTTYVPVPAQYAGMSQNAVMQAMRPTPEPPNPLNRPLAPGQSFTEIPRPIQSAAPSPFVAPTRPTSTVEDLYNQFRQYNPDLPEEMLRAAAQNRANYFQSQYDQEMQAYNSPASVAARAKKTTPVDYSDMPMGVTGGGDEYWKPGGTKDQLEEAARKWRESKGLPPTPAASGFFNPYAMGTTGTPQAYQNLASRFGEFFDPAAGVAMPSQEAAGAQQGASYNPYFTGYNIAPLAMPRFFKDGGSPTHFPRKTGPINGPGTGTSDSIPAMLSDGEFVFTAKAVRNAGGGSRRKGAKRMYALMKKLEGGAVKG